MIIIYIILAAAVLAADLAAVMRIAKTAKKRIIYSLISAVSTALISLPSFVGGHYGEPYVYIILAVTGLLNVIAVCDLYTMYIPNVLLYALNGLGALCSFFVPDTSFVRVIIAAWLITGMCFLIGRKAKGAIHKGDLFCMSGLMMCMSFDSMISFMIGALFSALVYSLIMLAAKKTTLKTEIPFAPFLLIGFVATALF